MPDGKKWLTENLNIETADSWCYNSSPDSCMKYGKLYTWEAAKSACQSIGKRLPTNAEWDALVTAAGGQAAGERLKAKSGWYNYGNGTDQYGFSALSGGRRLSDGDFDNAGYYGYWWTATEDKYSGGDAYYKDMGYDYDFVYNGSYEKSKGYSVRCIEN